MLKTFPNPFSPHICYVTWSVTVVKVLRKDFSKSPKNNTTTCTPSK